MESETLKERSGSLKKGEVEVLSGSHKKKVESKSLVEVGAVSNCLLDLFHRRALPPPPGAKTEILLPDLYFCFAKSVQYIVQYILGQAHFMSHPQGMKYIFCQILVSHATWGLLAASKS